MISEMMTGAAKGWQFVAADTHSEIPDDNDALQRRVVAAQDRAQRVERFLGHPVVTWGGPVILGLLVVLGICKWNRK